MDELKLKAKKLKTKFYFYMVLVIIAWLISFFFDVDKLGFYLFGLRYAVICKQYADVKKEIKKVLKKQEDSSLIS